jgi:tRNA pseudouridine55 synthase
LAPASITIHSLEILEYQKNELKLRILCSKGTYIRALARDMGKALGSGAYMAKLRRTSIGDYKVNDAMELKIFEEKLNIL